MSYLDGLLKLVLRVFGGGTYVASVGGGTTGLNFLAPLIATPNAQTQNVDIGYGGTSVSFTDITLSPEAQPSAPSSGWKIYVDSVDGQLKAENASGKVIVLSNLIRLNNSKTLSANNTPANVPIFGITGSVRVNKLYGVVTTVIGSNHTGSKFRTNDGTATIDLGTAAGVALSSAPVESIVFPTYFSGSDVTAVEIATAGRVSSASGGLAFENYVIVQKSAITTNIEYQYATTNTPTSGVIQFFIEYEPLSADGAVTTV